jgi:hypothetical protein
MSYPYCQLGPSFYLVAFFKNLTMQTTKINQQWYVPFMLSWFILAQWWHPVASSEALDLLHCAVHGVTYRRLAMAIKMASKVGAFFYHCLFACQPGGRWSITEQVIAQ